MTKFGGFFSETLIRDDERRILRSQTPIDAPGLRTRRVIITQVSGMPETANANWTQECWALYFDFRNSVDLPEESAAIPKMNLVWCFA